jgi:probable rRNA maturation factor
VNRAGKTGRAGRAPAINIDVQIASRAKGIPAARSLRLWARSALSKTKPANMTLRVVTQGEARALNHAYRGKDYATNVLTFVYDPLPEDTLHGDIVLCAAVVAAEAKQQGKTLAGHYAHLTVHGVLHLQGLDHERPAEARRMEALEIKLLSKLGYADPYG